MKANLERDKGKRNAPKINEEADSGDEGSIGQTTSNNKGENSRSNERKLRLLLFVMQKCLDPAFKIK